MQSELNVSKRHKAILSKKGIVTYEDILNKLPRGYIDYRTQRTSVDYSMTGETACYLGTILPPKKKNGSNCKIVSFKLCMENHVTVSCVIMGKAFMYDFLKKYEEDGVTIAVFGELSYKEPYGFSIFNPDFIVPKGPHNAYLKLTPVYTKYEGISDDYMKSIRNDAIAKLQSATPEYLSGINCPADSLREAEEKYGINLMNSVQAYRSIHEPKDYSEIKEAGKRLALNKLYPFFHSLENLSLKEAKGTAVTLNSLKITRSILETLPYKLTADQSRYIKEILQSIRDGRRVSALIQGDVGCGKTMVAILLLFAMAENGYQGVLMAPTSILAKQHYQEMENYASKYGIEIAYLDSSVTKRQKDNILKGVSEGKIKILVGTQSLASDKITYNKLGIVIIDEEHRFGVEQRDKLLSEAQNGVNTILMSATPIPRTLAGALYGSKTTIYDIKTMPAQRQPIQTATNNNESVISDFIEKQLSQGRQAYIVCPLISKENNDSNIMAVEDVAALYKDRFEPFYKVGILTGKMKEKETDEVICAFKENRIHILVSTTVVEVGVNVPNASVMVIRNAERFGLATMHQLRGRVGRGSYKGYCILQSKEKTPRLQIMENCKNGFEIAEEDLKLRGAGDLVGNMQSGFSEVMELAKSDAALFETAEKIIKDIFSENILSWL